MCTLVTKDCIWYSSVLNDSPNFLSTSIAFCVTFWNVNQSESVHKSTVELVARLQCCCPGMLPSLLPSREQLFKHGPLVSNSITHSSLNDTCSFRSASTMNSIGHVYFECFASFRVSCTVIIPQKLLDWIAIQNSESG